MILSWGASDGNLWICDKCLDAHSTLLGCSTASLECKKEEHLQNKDMILANFEEGANNMSKEIQEHKKLAERHAEEEISN